LSTIQYYFERTKNVKITSLESSFLSHVNHYLSISLALILFVIFYTGCIKKKPLQKCSRKLKILKLVKNYLYCVLPLSRKGLLVIVFYESKSNLIPLIFQLRITFDLLECSDTFVLKLNLMNFSKLSTPFFGICFVFFHYSFYRKYLLCIGNETYTPEIFSNIFKKIQNLQCINIITIAIILKT
jgi:hypothetical protein